MRMDGSWPDGRRAEGGGKEISCLRKIAGRCSPRPSIRQLRQRRLLRTPLRCLGAPHHAAPRAPMMPAIAMATASHHRYEKPMAKCIFIGLTLALAVVSPTLAQQPTQRFEDFATDPQWDSYRSHLLPNPLPVTRQDFGRRAGDAGRSAIGGWIQ